MINFKIKCDKCKSRFDYNETYGLCPNCNYYNSPPNTNPDLDFVDTNYIKEKLEQLNSNDYDNDTISTSTNTKTTNDKSSNQNKLVRTIFTIVTIFMLFDFIPPFFSAVFNGINQPTISNGTQEQNPYLENRELIQQDNAFEEFEKCDLPVTLIIEDSIVTGYSNPPNIISTQIIIPEGVTEIADYAFFNCHDAEILMLSNTVKRIGEGAFLDLPNLKYIYLFSDELEIIDNYAFSNVVPEQIYFPPNVKYIGDFAMNMITLDAQYLEGIELGQYAVKYN